MGDGSGQLKAEHMPRTIEERILDRTDKILRILAALATKGLKQHEQIELLDKAGFEPRDIADLLGTTGNTVRVALVKLRREKGSRKRKQSKKTTD